MNKCIVFVLVSIITLGQHLIFASPAQPATTTFTTQHRKSIVGLPKKEWYEHATIYQIYPRSFMDSNADGIGDLNGITSKLDHLSDIGVNAIWMSPMFESPQKDFGYDVSDFYAVHHEYGTMADFEAFMTKANKLGLNVLLDFVPNHSSDEHEWFRNSVRRESGFEDFYVWHNGTVDQSGKPRTPNNWASFSYFKWYYCMSCIFWYLFTMCMFVWACLKISQT